MTKNQARQLVSDAYYGENAAIGDGTFLDMLAKFFAQLIGDCPLGARRAHRMINGGPIQQRIALNRLEYMAYQWTGDPEVTAKIVEVGKKLGQSVTENDFVQFAA